MHSRERWERFFSGKPIDRIPIWLLFPYHKVTYYTDVCKNPRYQRILAKVREHNIDILDRRNFDTGFCFNSSPDIAFREKRRQDRQDSVIVDQIIEYKDMSLTRSYVQRGTSCMQTKSFVTTIDDLLSILEPPYTPPRPSLDSFFREKDELGNKGLMMADAGDAMATLYHLCSLENFSMWSILEKEKLTYFLDHIHQRVMDFYRYLLDNGIGPVFFAVGAEFMGPPMVSPNNFPDLAGKYLKDMVSLVHSYGNQFILHYHGNIKQVLPDIREINPDAVHTIEAPPVGDCTIKQARDILGDRIALVGNIQYDDLLRLSQEDIRHLVKEALEQAKGGRFILSPTAGPYEDMISDKMIDNYIALIEAGVEMGK